MIPTLILFWLFVTIVAVCMTWSNYLARLASEKTIRLAIDKGLILDPAAIDRLRPPHNPHWDVRLIVLGAVVIFVGFGACWLGALLAIDKPKSLYPMLGIGGFAVIVGAGVLISGLWLRRIGRD